MNRAAEPERAWQRPVAVGLMGVGLALLAAAPLAPSDWLSDGDWSQEEAKQFQQAAAELHRLSLAPDGDQQTDQARRESRLEVAEMSVRLEQSAGSADRARRRLRWVGGALCLAGGVWLLATRTESG